VGRGVKRYITWNKPNWMKYELYRRKNKIKRQENLIQKFLENEEFVLIVLDACRYDYFEEIHGNYFNGDLHRAWSPENRTPYWVPTVWNEKYDITYISASPWLDDHSYEDRETEFRPSEHFNKIINVWKTDWNSDFGTVPPEAVTESSLTHLSESRPARTIIHYLQPHRPYIGDEKLLPWKVKTKDLKLNEGVDFQLSKTDKNDNYVTGERLYQNGITKLELDEAGIPVESYGLHKRAENDDINHKRLDQAYRDNLVRVLISVNKLVSYINCPVVITADHGDHLGGHLDELPQYSHPNVTHPVLREVPWFEIDDNSRGTNQISDYNKEASTSDSSGHSKVNERLAALGYKK